MDFLVRKDTGTRMAYQINKSNHPDAETIVFVHGLSFDRHIWDSIIDGFSDEYHIVTYDMGGHGDSEPLGLPLTWDLFCQGFIQVVDHLGIETCHLVGHGFGGIVTIKSAIQFTDRIDTLTLVSTPLYFPEDVFDYEYKSRIFLLENDFDGFVDKLVRGEVNQPVGEKRTWVENGIRRVDKDTYKNGIHLIFGDAFSLMEDLPKIEVPTLLMSGDRNSVFPPHYMALYASVIRASRVQIIPNASNAVFIDHPEIFTDALKDFLKTYSGIHQAPGYAFLLNKMRVVLESAYKLEVAAPVLEIRALGKFSVSWKGVPIDGKWTQRSAKELLLYLSMRKSVTRERLIDAFFSEVDADKAKNYLRVMLNHIKSLFEATGDQELIDSFKITRETIQLKCQISSDLTLFLGTLKRGFHRSRDLYDMKMEFLQLLELYQSGFLLGLNAPWITDLRFHIENKFSNALIKLVAWFEEEELYDDALQLLREAKSVEIYEGYSDEKIEDILAKKEH
ncbi:MAG TPA: alpha/beta fold hydrolase [Sporolactobacillaceae bacterium]|nr:alpha/beta fold hydrolase [Sporolactobacillaceae bacterium]